MILALKGFARMTARDGRSDVLQTDPATADGGPAEAASFIADAVAELAQLSRTHRLDMLTHLLEMTQLEADDFARRQTRPGHF